MIASAYPLFLYLGLPLIVLAGYWYWYYYKDPIYLFSSLIAFYFSPSISRWRRTVLFLLRLAILTALCLALARLQTPDERSKIPVQGIDIMLVLDTSGSMAALDDLKDRRPRIDVARAEALKFIDRRDNDPIGLVIFAGAAISRCPLTLDKRMLKEILGQTTTETVSAPGTVLSRAIMTAANRLKKSTAKTKIMIVLTDGEPTENDSDPEKSIEVAKKLGIKIYTVGIGGERQSWLDHPFYGLVQIKSNFNKALLKKLALETGGQFFHARNPADMEAIYTTIDKLERTDYETPLFARYFEYFVPLIWCALLFLLIEIFLTSFVWIRL